MRQSERKPFALAGLAAALAASLVPATAQDTPAVFILKLNWERGPVSAGTGGQASDQRAHDRRRPASGNWRKHCRPFK